MTMKGPEPQGLTIETMPGRPPTSSCVTGATWSINLTLSYKDDGYVGHMDIHDSQLTLV
jgi:hypothetical protein